MIRRLLIDAKQTEETRVITTSNDLIDDFEYEVHSRRQLKGNIYLARVTRVEPSLQAAFVEYGGNRQGFLAFSEIHPDYYRIPIEDRQKLIAEAYNKTDEELIIGDNINDENEEDVNEDELKKVKKNLYKNYKIQEVIARRQILLVQVVKEERGTKGAALTTYISIAGRYCVLMPNTPRGGGVSRKIGNLTDRKRLKKIVDDLDLSKGMALIIRTAGCKRTKNEIKRDYLNSITIWENVKNLTLESNAPSLIHEEGSLVKRAIRDLYHNEIDEVLVEGGKAYKVCKNYMKALMPSHAKKVQQYNNEKRPIFQNFNLDSQLDDIFNPKVTLNSGGYLVIDQTEALVAIDVNSGKATRERSIENTALTTNLEAAEEFARQARLRDLSGLIVIDFIDMEDNKNRHNVEKKLRDSMRKDRARIQIGEISTFGLLEMSRQRLRPSVVENSSELCSHCGGSGRIQSIEVSAIQILRSIEEEGMNEDNSGVKIHAHSAVILHILNNKRDQLSEIENRYDVKIQFINDDSIIPPLKKLDIIKKANLNSSINNDINEKKEISIQESDENNSRKKKVKKSIKKNRKTNNINKNNNVKTVKTENQNFKNEDKNNIENNLEEEKIEKKSRKQKKVKESSKQSKKNKSNNKVVHDVKDNFDKLKTNNKKSLEKENQNKNKIANVRELKSSRPIEVVKVEENSDSNQPKRKGWWSK